MARYVDLDKYVKFDAETEFDVWCSSISNDYCKKHDCVECFYENGGKEDVAPILHAEWIYAYIMGRPFSIMCSNCHIKLNTLKDMPYNFCPFCGALMDKE